MKSSSLILLCSWLLSAVGGCKKSDFLAVESTCNLEAPEIKNVQNKTGTLFYYDHTSDDGTYWQGYFIVNHDVSEIGSLPIRICNFPEQEFPVLKHGDQLRISFNGRVVVLPEEVDALNTDMELTGIRATE